jgi:uncharacterized membrane protein YphA (DoxX/SURF4 family)
MSKGQKIALWSVSILLAAMFLFAGLPKLLNLSQTKTMFVAYGYPGWFAILIGVSEVLGAVGLLVPRLAALAASGLSIIMVGAFLTHVLHHEYQHSLIPLVLLAVLVAVGYGRFRESRA